MQIFEGERQIQSDLFSLEDAEKNTSYRVLCPPIFSICHKRVCPFVGPSVRRSVRRLVGDAFVKKQEINIFEQISGKKSTHIEKIGGHKTR